MSVHKVNNLSKYGEPWSAEDSLVVLLDDGPAHGFFSGGFIPPPPRPMYLEDTISSDGLTTCDLCAWAWKSQNTFSIEHALEIASEFGWFLTLVVVSLISAAVGAIVMIILLHCKRLKTTHPQCNPNQPGHINRPPISTPDDKSPQDTPLPFSHLGGTPLNGGTPMLGGGPMCNAANMNGVWSWLARRSNVTPTQLDTCTPSPVENHYTHMTSSETNGVGCPNDDLTEALYAEVDEVDDIQDDQCSDDTNTSSSSSALPAYQNAAYTDHPLSSAPSSAYYSDLSVTTMTAGERAYEVVGLVNMPPFAVTQAGSAAAATAASIVQVPWDLHRSQRLAVISENSSAIPSDYV